jgi:hypothetical protein
MFENLYCRPEPTRKRAHEDDDVVDTAGLFGLPEHRNKRIHSLPLRSSPPGSHRRWAHDPLSFPATQLASAARALAEPEPELENLHQRQQHHMMELDRDTDMMLDDSDTLTSNASRLPTPIHATFASQMRGNHWSASVQSPGSLADASHLGFGTNAVVPGAMPHHAFPDAADPSIPRSLDGSAGWSMVQNRRLPSPISESGGEEAPPSPGMILDSSSPIMRRPHLPHLPHSTNPAAMAALHPNIEICHQPPPHGDTGMMDTDCETIMEDQEGHSPSSAPATPSPRSKFGHSRNKHTVNSWTLQPGMKKSFSIGYRADCEKCRLKVPGHFNHIIVS